MKKLTAKQENELAKEGEQMGLSKKDIHTILEANRKSYQLNKAFTRIRYNYQPKSFYPNRGNR